MSDEAKVLEAKARDQRKALQETEAKLAALKRAAEAERLKPLQQTAARAHEALCSYNHTDGCSWGYEEDNWAGAAHSRWLRKIDELVNGGSGRAAITNLTEIIILLKAVEEIKPKVPTALFLLRTGLAP